MASHGPECQTNRTAAVVVAACADARAVYRIWSPYQAGAAPPKLEQAARTEEQLTSLFN